MDQQERGDALDAAAQVVGADQLVSLGDVHRVERQAVVYEQFGLQVTDTRLATGRGKGVAQPVGGWETSGC